MEQRRNASEKSGKAAKAGLRQLPYGLDYDSLSSRVS